MDQMESEPNRRSRVAKLLLVLGLLLVVNSAYLAAFSDLTLFYVANALIHPFLGIVAAVLFGVFVARYRSFFAGGVGRAAAGLLGLSALFGLYLAVVGMTRPHS